MKVTYTFWNITPVLIRKTLYKCEKFISSPVSLGTIKCPVRLSQVRLSNVCLQLTTTTHQATSPVGRRMDNRTQRGAMVCKFYSTYESWRGNCACWNNDSWDLTPNIPIQSVQNWASGSAFSLSVLGVILMQGFGGCGFSTEKLVLWREGAASLPGVIFSPGSVSRCQKERVKKKFVCPTSRTSILLRRWLCIVIYYLYFTEWVPYVFLWGMVLIGREYVDTATDEIFPRKETCK